MIMTDSDSARLHTVDPKNRFLMALSFIYLFALSSLYIQLPGLYGDNGILPIRLFSFTIPSGVTDFLEDPNVLRLSAFVNLDSFLMLELCVVVGCLLAFLAAFWSEFRNAFVFLILWLIYYSAAKVGQVFLWFQWDLLLLEVGFIAILLAKMTGFSSQNTASDRLALWLLRWLLFRLMFSAGVVKLTSNCASWWGLTALHWHYQSQCIPTPLAWYFHHLPGWFHSFCVVSTLIIEIPLPLLFFVPLRTIRVFSFYSQVFLQVLILLTGNYNFFNLLTIALCYSLLKDEDFRPRETGRQTWSDVSSTVVSWLLIILILGVGAYMFRISLAPDLTVKSSIGFTKQQFNSFVTQSVIYSIGFALALYFIEFLFSLACALRAHTGRRKAIEVLGVIIVGFVGFVLLSSSLVPLASLDHHRMYQLPPSVHRIHRRLVPYHLTNSYGLFRRMTGAGGRPEVVITGAPTESGPWTEYHFRFKPGRLNQTPPLIVPHQPRLDWQMWFAALSSPDNEPWFYNLVFRLLQQEPDVLGLLDTSVLPRNPKFIRAQLYTYHYTSPTDGSGNWWRRVRKLEFLPPVSLSSPQLQSTVEQNGLIGKRRLRPRDPTLLSALLSRLRSFVGQPADLMPLLVVCLTLGITKYAFLTASEAARLRPRDG